MKPQQQVIFEVENPEATQRAERMRQQGIHDEFPLPPIITRFSTYHLPEVGDELNLTTGIGKGTIRITKRTFIIYPDAAADDVIVKLAGDNI